MLAHAVHQFHDNDLFASAAAMSYFGLMTLFPALLLLLALSNKIAAGNEMIARVVQVYPGSTQFLRETIRSLSGISSDGKADALRHPGKKPTTYVAGALRVCNLLHK